MSISLETIDETEDILDTTTIPKDQDFAKMTKVVNKVQKRVVDIMRSQQYQINKEDEYAKKQIENSNIIVYMTIAQATMVLLFTIWQIVSLKNVFKNN
jgi:hypothetical protein